LVLTEAQLDAVARAEYPLQPHQRIAFRSALERWLADRPAVGDGELHRMLVQLQRQHFHYPDKTRYRA
jgi:hypothetical protein